jgi:transposase
MTTHSKKLKEKAPSDTLWVGIDVSKHELQIHFLKPSPGLPEKLPYDKPSLAKLVAHLKRDGRYHVIFEATGGYEKPLLKCLQVNGIRCSRTNPWKVRSFANAKGRIAKTDKIDAAVLAEFGACIQPTLTRQSDPAWEELGALINYRRHLCDELKREEMQLEQPKPAAIATMIKARIRTLKAQIGKLRASIDRHVAAHDTLKEAVEALSAVDGVGTLTAASLLSAMPELGKLNRNQAAALAGLAPMNCDSGTMKGKQTTYGGRVAIRQAIYMSALVASRHNATLKKAYQDLLSRGKAKKVALIALARKLLVYLNSVMTKLLEKQLLPLIAGA